jgi:hypothetical protein
MPWFCGLSDTQTRMWETEVANHYPSEVQRELERVVEAALLHKDDLKNEIPIPIKWSWVATIKSGPSKGVVTTSNAWAPTKPFYFFVFL